MLFLDTDSVENQAIDWMTKAAQAKPDEFDRQWTALNLAMTALVTDYEDPTEPGSSVGFVRRSYPGHQLEYCLILEHVNLGPTSWANIVQLVANECRLSGLYSAVVKYRDSLGGQHGGTIRVLSNPWYSDGFCLLALFC